MPKSVSSERGGLGKYFEIVSMPKTTGPSFF